MDCADGWRRTARIISGQDADRPRWAPDGKRFLFVSTKESGSQIWIADFDGAKGTASGTHKLTSIATEADGPLWSPDGKNILLFRMFIPSVMAHQPGNSPAMPTRSKWPTHPR